MTPLPPWENLSLAQQIAQMIVVRASGHLFDHQIQYPVWEAPSATLQHWIQGLGVGGVILLGGSAAELAMRSQQLQAWAQIPLLICADVEEGVGQRFPGATWFAPPMALAAIAAQNPALAEALAEKMGQTIAAESLAIGINWLLAPVVDVNNNPDNPVINVRAFGDHPAIVSRLTQAFIRGAHGHPVLTTAKHFPGHGDTATDSHLDLPVIPHSLERLSELELVPFQSAIQAGVDGIMSAHLRIPAYDAQYPATLSPAILTKLLRQDLSFEGLVVTDALVMGAIAKHYGANEAAVLAVEAGADILLMPVDAEGAIQAIIEAVHQGRISRDRIQASCQRIFQAKQKLSPPTIDLNLTAHLSLPQAQSTAVQILQHSQQTFGEFPLSSVSGGRNLIWVDRLLDCPVLHRQSPAIVIPQGYGYEAQLCDRASLEWFLSQESLGQEKGQPSAPTILQLFVRGNPFRGSAGTDPQLQTLFKNLLRNQSLQGLVIYGSPYIQSQFLPLLPPGFPSVFSYGQMSLAQEMALQALFAKSIGANESGDSPFCE